MKFMQNIKHAIRTNRQLEKQKTQRSKQNAWVPNRHQHKNPFHPTKKTSSPNLRNHHPHPQNQP